MNSALFSSPIIRRMATAVNARRLCIIACVCLLVVAAALRFYNLSNNSLWFDEARAAVNARGALSEVVVKTRHENSSPILYPLALWAVQKAASTDLSVRVLPAAASALTVVALLLLMPRLGVPRRAAFIAALLAALSAAAIEHAQDTREYSVDALCAVLMIAGLLQYLRDGRKALLCAALFAAPLLQYGLILFGGAVIGAAALAPAAAAAQAGGDDGRRPYAAAVWRHIGRRIDLLLPIACFAAACALSWELITKYQWVDGGWGGGGRGNNYYLANYYYQGGFDAAAIAQFAIVRTWDLLIYHMPPIIAGAALVAFGALAALAVRRRRGVNALALLCALALGAALCAALASAYPLGDVRQCLYLGPIVFLAVGGAFHSLAGDVGALARRAWAAAALTAAACVAIALAGFADIQQRNVYHSDDGIKRIFAILDERAQEGDGVYVSAWEFPLVTFYKREKPDNYYYGREVCWESSGRGCVDEVFYEMFSASGGSKRIWMIHTVSVSAQKEMAAYAPEVAVEEVASYGWTTLHLITGHEELAAGIHREWLAMYDEAVSGALVAADDYNLYQQGNALYYAKRPCARADTEERFFLHIYPEDAADLPANRRSSGFDNLDFEFRDYGFLTGDKCVIRIELPAYPIIRIHTGQFAYPDGGVIWEAEAALNSQARVSMYETAVIGALAAVGYYNIYFQGDALYYAKQPCVPADTEGRFFLRVYPEDARDLPAGQRRRGYDSIDFDFHDYGLRAADRCVIRRELPEYGIDRIHAGQYIYPGGPAIWEAEFPFKPSNLNERIGMYETAAALALSAASTYNLYLQDKALYYAKRPCAPEDTEDQFFLNIYPENAADLPAGRRQYGHAVVNFKFSDYGLLAAKRCVARRELPAYPIERIHTGQYIYPDGPVVWEVEFPFRRFNLDEWLAMYDEAVSAAPRAASIYNVYIQGNELRYAKQPCAAEDVEDQFFMNIYPEDAGDLPAGRRQYGHGVVDFNFRDYGLRAADKCLMRYPLPDYPVRHIHTGQYVYPDGPITWEVEFPFNP